MLKALHLWLWLVLAASPLLAKEPVTEDDIRKLIDQLVSANPAPITGGEDDDVAPDYKLRPGSDRAKQKVVHQARGRLRELGPAVFPLLIERWDDRRYSMTKSVGINGYCYNASVGDVCRDLVESQLQPYGIWPATDDDPRGQPKRPDYPGTFLEDARAATKWCQQNKGKSLYEMQLMVIDWIAAEEAKRPGDFTAQERAKVKAIRDQLLKERKPLVSRGNDDIEF